MGNNKRLKGVSQIKLGAMISYISIAVNVLAGLLYTPWMVQRLGQSQYGIYTLAYSLITMFLLDFGLSSAASRFVAKYHAEGDEEKVNNFLGVIYKLYIMIDAVIFVALIIMYFCIEIVYRKLTPEEIAQFKVVYIIAASFSLINFPFVTLNGILTAYEKFIPLKLADLIYRVLIVGMMVIALLTGHGLYSLVIVNAICGLIIIAYKLIVIKKTIPVKVNFKYFDKSLLKEIFGFSIWTALSAIALRLIFNITPTILGVVASAGAIAVFGIVNTIESYTYILTTAINGMFLPKISRIYAKIDKDSNIMPLMLKVGRFQYALNGLVFAGFATVGKDFILLWMGEKYILAYYGILLVIFPGIFYNSLQIANTTMVVTNKVKWQAFINIIIGVVNVILSFALSSLWGVVGACISICIAYIIRVVLFNYVFYKKMDIDIPQFVKKCYLRMSPPILITIAAGFGINILLNKSGWLFLAIKVVIIGSVYLLSTWLTTLNKQEKKDVLSFLHIKK